MTFAEKLKSVRRLAGLSQEKLAEKLGVSRQAVTKWETDSGIPDIENIKALSALFGVSIDELLSSEKMTDDRTDALYESLTEYDMEAPKLYDMKLGGAKTMILSGYDGEKLRVRLASNTLATLQSDFKLKIDDIKKRIDLDISRKNGMTEAAAKEALTVFLHLPNKYMGRIELRANAETIELRSLECDGIELDVKAQNVILDRVVGTVEVNCNLDMNLVCRTLNGRVEINQLSAASRICVPEGTPFSVAVQGFGTSVTYEKDGRTAEPFSVPEADNAIQLNGVKSELVICTFTEGGR